MRVNGNLCSTLAWRVPSLTCLVKALSANIFHIILDVLNTGISVRVVLALGKVRQPPS